jgi:hypothetical protein
MSHMELRIFDLYGTDRLAEWKKFRNHLEVSERPFEDLSKFWSTAPFVSLYLNPNNSSSWPDPWQLILDGKFDDLAISLGMLYTLKLTERFKNSQFELRQTLEKTPKSFLVVDNSIILNWKYREITPIFELKNIEFRVLESKIVEV